MRFPEDFDRMMGDRGTQELDLPTAIKDAAYQERITIYKTVRLEGTFEEILKKLNGGER